MDIFHITGKGIILYYNLFGKSGGIYLNLKCIYPLVQKPVIRLNTIRVKVSVTKYIYKNIYKYIAYSGRQNKTRNNLNVLQERNNQIHFYLLISHYGI